MYIVCNEFSYILFMCSIFLFFLFVKMWNRNIFEDFYFLMWGINKIYLGVLELFREKIIYFIKKYINKKSC